MSKQQKRHFIAEHLWRALRALLLLIGCALWLFTTAHPLFIFTCYLLAAVVDQLHGFICNRIEKAFGWEQDFNDLD